MQAGEGLVLLRDRLPQVVRSGAHRLLEQRKKELVLAGEVLVEAPERLARPLHDLLDREVLARLAVHEVERRVEEALHALLGPGPSRVERPCDGELPPTARTSGRRALGRRFVSRHAISVLGREGYGAPLESLDLDCEEACFRHGGRVAYVLAIGEQGSASLGPWAISRPARSTRTTTRCGGHTATTSSASRRSSRRPTTHGRSSSTCRPTWRTRSGTRRASSARSGSASQASSTCVPIRCPVRRRPTATSP